MPTISMTRPAHALPSMASAAQSFRLPRFAPAAGGVVLLLALLMLALSWREPNLTRLSLEGSFDRVHPEAVRRAASSHLQQGGGFFSVDIDTVRDTVSALPWVARARVERDWPSGLHIRVWEREPYARWNGDSLLDTGAIAFTPARGDLSQKALDAMPFLGGTPGNEALVMQSYRKLSEALAATPFALAGLQIDARGEWTAQTRSGLELRLGHGNPEDKLGIITGALPAALGDRLPDAAYIDLRYTNGFAIGWREAAGKAAEQSSGAKHG